MIPFTNAAIGRRLLIDFERYSLLLRRYVLRKTLVGATDSKSNDYVDFESITELSSAKNRTFFDRIAWLGDLSKFSEPHDLITVIVF